MELDLLNLLFVLLAAWLAGAITSRLGYPAIFGELMAGIILGPPLLGWLHGTEALSVLAEIGVLLMMLYIGMEINPRELFEASWGGFLAAIGGFITPFALAYLVITLGFGGSTMAGLFTGIAAGVTSLATKSRILSDLKLLDTRIAHVMMAGALVADSLSLIIFAAILSLLEIGTLEASRILLVGVEVVIFFGATVFVGLKVFPVIWKYLSKWGLTSRTFHVTLILLITILFAELAELAGLHAILGAFLVGLFIRDGIGMDHRIAGEITHLVRDVSIGFLAPIFFITAGFHVGLDVFTTALPLLLTVIVVATLGKIVGTALFYLLSGNGWREGLTIGAGMNGRGAVEIIIAEIALRAGIIDQEIFSVLVFMAIFTTATVPVFLKWGTDWLRNRGELIRASDKRVGTVILGAGASARSLAKAIQSPEQPVWLIDINLDHIRRAKEEGLNALYGNALNEDTLQKAHISDARWFLALTSNTESNLLSAQLARNVFSVPEVYVLLTREDDGALQRMLSEMGAYAVQNSELNITEWDSWDAKGHEITSEAFEVESSTHATSALEKLIQSGLSLLPLAVEQDSRRIPFVAADEVSAGDKLHVLQLRLVEE